MGKQVAKPRALNRNTTDDLYAGFFEKRRSENGFVYIGGNFYSDSSAQIHLDENETLRLADWLARVAAYIRASRTQKVCAHGVVTEHVICLDCVNKVVPSQGAQVGRGDCVANRPYLDPRDEPPSSTTQTVTEGPQGTTGDVQAGKAYVAPADSLASAAAYVEQEMASAKRCCAECESKFIQSTQYHVEKAFIMGAASTRPEVTKMGKEPWQLIVGTKGNLTLGNLQLAKMSAATAIDSKWRIRQDRGEAVHGEALDGLKFWVGPDFKGWVIPEMWAAMSSDVEAKGLNG